jgi:hypothetical protein
MLTITEDTGFVVNTTEQDEETTVKSIVSIIECLTDETSDLFSLENGRRRRRDLDR